MKKFYTLATLLSLIVLSSCEDKIKSFPQRRSFIPYRFEGPDNIRELTFNDSGLLTRVANTTKFSDGTRETVYENFTYDNRRVQECYTSKGSVHIYQYTNGQITRTNHYQNGVLTEIYEFQYDINGRVSQQISYQVTAAGADPIPTEKTEYEYDNENNVVISRLYSYTASSTPKLSIVHRFSNYDDKINVNSVFWTDLANPSLILQKNNPGKIETTNGDGIFFSKEICSYSYNANQNVVISSVVQTLYNGSIGNYSIQFEYK